MSRPIARWFDTDSEWRRPLPAGWARRDLVVAVVALAVSAVGLELSRSAGALQHSDAPVWEEYALLVAAAAMLPLRRRAPIAVGVLATVHLLVASTLASSIAAQVGLQVLYFVAVFSAADWARDRRALAAAAAGVGVVFLLWSAWYWALGRGVDDVHRLREDAGPDHTGLLPPVAAFLLFYALVNVAYFGGATAVGIAAWRSARRQARLAEQSELIAEQSAALAEAAVLDERLRIARELHDVVAHHVAAIGVQAGAARRNLPRRPELVGPALQAVEDSSRSAVTEMRALLGALRGGAEDDSSRAPEPGAADVPALVEQVRAPGFHTELVVATEPDAPLEDVPPAVGLSLYRIAQEALANTRRHSTAGRAQVALRTRGGQGRWAEVEVVDDGRPRAGTSGSGHGLTGIRERVAALGGEYEIGPRPVGGFRVRVRLPLGTGS